MLVNDPPVRVPERHRSSTRRCSRVAAMTYYGRWTYKYEIASAQGRGGGDHHSRDGTGGLSVRRRERQRLAGTVRRHLARRASKRVPVEGWITLDKAKEILSAAGKNFDSAQGRRDAKDFKPVALNAKATFHVKIDSRRDSVAQRRRQARGHRQEGRVRHLHGALGPPRQGHDAQGRPDLQRRDGQRVGQLGAAGDRQGVHEAANAAEAFDPLPLGDGGGEGAARRQVLRDASALSARQDGREHQHGRHQPVGQDERLHRRSDSATRRSTTICSPC